MSRERRTPGRRAGGGRPSARLAGAAAALEAPSTAAGTGSMQGGSSSEQGATAGTDDFLSSWHSSQRQAASGQPAATAALQNAAAAAPPPPRRSPTCRRHRLCRVPGTNSGDPYRVEHEAHQPIPPEPGAVRLAAGDRTSARPQPALPPPRRCYTPLLLQAAHARAPRAWRCPTAAASAWRSTTTAAPRALFTMLPRCRGRAGGTRLA